MQKVLLIALLMASVSIRAEGNLMIGTGVADLTPPIGTPSAGYARRQGQGMAAVHDHLEASAVIVHNGTKQIVFCGVDHLGFDFGMVQEVKERIFKSVNFKGCDLFVSSSHTHSGGGAFMDMPVVGEVLAGKFDPQIREYYIAQAANAIFEASKNMQPAKIGFATSKIDGIAHYRGEWPQDVTLPNQLNIIKLTSPSNEPLCVLFNFALHPTTLGSDNFQFSSDFVGVARDELKRLIGEGLVPIYINGAQGEVIPEEIDRIDEWANCRFIGEILSESVKQLWDNTQTVSEVEISTKAVPYTFLVEATPVGLQVPIEKYDSELNLILFDKTHAILTVPGELSSVYDTSLSKYAKDLGFDELAFYGLTNDAHGYIISPAAWDHKTQESQLSFGGRLYGERVTEMMKQLLCEFSPKKPKP